MMSGNVNLEQNSSDASSVINLKDSAMSGDVNITQNNAEDIAAAMVTALERNKIPAQSPHEASSQSPEIVPQFLEEKRQGFEAEYAQLLAGSKSLENRNDIDEINLSFNEKKLGEKADNAGSPLSAEQHYLRALKLFRKNGNRKEEADILGKLGNIACSRDDLVQAELFEQDALVIWREIDDLWHQSLSLKTLANFAIWKEDHASAERFYRESAAIIREDDSRTSRDLLSGVLRELGTLKQVVANDLDEAERLYRESIAISRDTGDASQEGESLDWLGSVLKLKGQHSEERRIKSESIRIWREKGLSVPKYYLDEGY
ncbi:tetratricopeptide repeat protein [Euryarchaeota archaeon]|nr:tetratricopeptide repeat protein [Euryarchaeota archaeon]